MEVRSAINILFSKFNINYRVFLYLFVVTAIVIRKRGYADLQRGYQKPRNDRIVHRRHKYFRRLFKGTDDVFAGYRKR